MPRSRKTPKQSTPAGKGKQKQGPLTDISETEQWRIIKDSGILEKVPVNKQESTSTTQEEEEGKLSPLAEEIFSALNLIIPHSFLLAMMDILIHYQYGQHPSYAKLISERLLPSVPILSIFIFYTSRYKQTRPMQAFLFALSIAMGIRLIYLINTASWKLNMKQAPPLATIWIYSIVQLNLLPAVLSLTIIYSWVYYKGMKLFF